DVKGSAALQIKYMELIAALFSDVNPIPVKAAMNRMGMNVGPCRLPLCDMADTAALEKALRGVGLL
ncbi:MAG: dihydrodipicolinate synthase family protein, partial [Oscillospiraceae bacterium]|nr:dihydrodipicolinate synthase family protein [Oscillospiraceae bacterium]